MTTTPDKIRQTKKKSKDSVFNRINKWLHLWLGLVSGVIVFIVCITACIWVFHYEITGMLNPEIRIEDRNVPVLRPSQIAEVARKVYPDNEVHYLYRYPNRPVILNIPLGDPHDHHADYALLYVNPYTGEIISDKQYTGGETDFFGFILKGHRFLWLDPAIGRPIVNYGTLVFVILLITGLIWWYPKKWNKSTKEKSFKIKWGASIKRLNIDLHNVLGFYSLLIALVLALTGMVYGIAWYNNGLYKITGGTNELYDHFHSDTLKIAEDHNILNAMDIAWEKVLQKEPDLSVFYYHFLDDDELEEAISITTYPDNREVYKHINYYFDRFTLQELKGTAVYSIPFEENDFAGKLKRMNFDLHVGTILGLPGKILAFIASLIGASLPITGFLIWYWRKFKKKKIRIR